MMRMMMTVRAASRRTAAAGQRLPPLPLHPPLPLRPSFLLHDIAARALCLSADSSRPSSKSSSSPSLSAGSKTKTKKSNFNGNSKKHHKKRKEEMSRAANEYDERQRELVRELTSICAKSPSSSRRSSVSSDSDSLTSFIDQRAGDLSLSSLVQLMYLVGKNNCNLTPTALSALSSSLATINLKLQEVNNRQSVGSFPLKSRDLGMIFLCLKRVNCSTPEAAHFVSTITDTLRAFNQSRDKRGTTEESGQLPQLPSRTVASICFGMQNLSSCHEEVCSMVSEVSSLIANSDSDGFDSRVIGNCLLGLKNMSSSHSPKVLQLLHILTLKMEGDSACREMEGLHVANALHGLKGMDSHHEEVRRLVRCLVSKFPITTSMTDCENEEGGNMLLTNTSALTMQPKEVCMSLHGLMNKSSSHWEVRALLKNLTLALTQLPPKSIDSAATSIVMYGLRNMSSQHREVLDLIFALSSRVIPHNDAGGGGPFSAGFHMSNSLYGLQGLDGDKSEVRCLVDILAKKIEATSAEVRMSGIQLSAAVYGLKTLPSCCVEVRHVLRLLADRITSSDVHFTDRAVKNLFYGLQNMSSNTTEVRELMAAVLNRLRQQDSRDGHNGFEANVQYGDDALRFGELVSTSFYGLREMSSDHDEVLAFLKWIMSKMRNIDSFTALEVANMLYGMQGLSNQHDEVIEAITMAGLVLESLEKSGGEMDRNTVFTEQGRGMCMYGLQQMSLDKKTRGSEEVESLLLQLTTMLKQSPSAGERHSSRHDVTYSDRYFSNNNASRPEHILGGLMLSLYGVASLQFNSFLRPHLDESEYVSRNMSDLFSQLKSSSSKFSSVSPIIFYGNDSRSRIVLIDALRALRLSFAEEEAAAFRSSLDDVLPYRIMKSMLNLRRNASMLHFFLFPPRSEWDRSEADVLHWLVDLQRKSENVFSRLKQDGHVTEVRSFTQGAENTTKMSVPFEFRNELLPINEILNIPGEERAVGTTVPPNPSDLTKLPPQSTLAFLSRELSRDEPSTGEGMVYNALLRAFVTGMCDAIITPANGQLPYSSPATVYINGVGSVCFISNQSFYEYDILLTHNEILFGVDTDIVVRLYRKCDNTIRDTEDEAGVLLPSSFHHPPAHTFNIEVDGPYHNYPRKIQFGKLRDLFLSRRRSASCIENDTPYVSNIDGENDDGERGVRVIRVTLDNAQHLKPSEMMTLIVP